MVNGREVSGQPEGGILVQAQVLVRGLVPSLPTTMGHGLVVREQVVGLG